MKNCNDRIDSDYVIATIYSLHSIYIPVIFIVGLYFLAISRVTRCAFAVYLRCYIYILYCCANTHYLLNDSVISETNDSCPRRVARRCEERNRFRPRLYRPGESSVSRVPLIAPAETVYPFRAHPLVEGCSRAKKKREGIPRTREPPQVN